MIKNVNPDRTTRFECKHETRTDPHRSTLTNMKKEKKCEKAFGFLNNSLVLVYGADAGTVRYGFYRFIPNRIAPNLGFSKTQIRTAS